METALLEAWELQSSFDPAVRFLEERLVGLARRGCLPRISEGEMNGNSGEGDEWARMRAHVRKAVERLPPEVRFRAVNACDGIEKAERLLELDREIASFRAITAQEEAAAALFAALRRMKYPGADRLNPYAHPHKAALWFFVDAAQHSLGKSLQALKMSITVNASTPEVQISIPASQFGIKVPGQPDLVLQPVDPFHVLQSRSGTAYLFDEEIDEIVAARGGKSVDRYIRKLANERNRLLYASDTGPPASQATLSSIHHRRERVYLVLIICIGVLQTRTIQHFIHQCLQAVLKIVGKAEDLDPPTGPEVDVDIVLRRYPPEDSS